LDVANLNSSADIGRSWMVLSFT